MLNRSGAAQAARWVNASRPVTQLKRSGGATQAERRKPPGVLFTRFNAILTSNELAPISRGRITAPLKIEAEWRKPSGESHTSQHRAACAAPLQIHSSFNSLLLR
jgi:hypothetical protein